MSLPTGAPREVHDGCDMRLVLALFLIVADVGEQVEAFVRGLSARRARDTATAATSRSPSERRGA